ncbi:hypothetical protein F5Y19DRAFT_470131 [Xylariaceae sp. FL1651]|nr:hypothetical protein F5Y19DRAFT_470131 [Xylariaceae sp. FL1651]
MAARSESNTNVVPNDWVTQLLAEDLDPNVLPGNSAPADLLSLPVPNLLRNIAALEPLRIGSHMSSSRVASTPAPAPAIPASSLSIQRAPISAALPSPVLSPAASATMATQKPTATNTNTKENAAPMPRGRSVVRVTNEDGEEVNLADLAPNAKPKPMGQRTSAAERVAKPQPVSKKPETTTKGCTKAASTVVAIATTTTIELGFPKSTATAGPAHAQTPGDALARLAFDLKDADFAVCAAFLKNELLSHAAEPTGPEANSSDWPPQETMKRFIAALHDKFPPRGDAVCDEKLSAWVFEVTVAVDELRLAQSRRRRADALISLALGEVQGEE